MDQSVIQRAARVTLLLLFLLLFLHNHEGLVEQVASFEVEAIQIFAALAALDLVKDLVDFGKRFVEFR